MSVIGILADDFTGANDTGIQFAKHGISTVTILNADEAELELFNNVEVIVINTETRNLNSTEAYQKVQKAAETLLTMGLSFIYKKIDSTMRGYPGIELLSLMRVKKVTVGVISPAFPANGRMVAGGFLFVNEGPLKQKFSKGLNLMQLIGEQAKCNVRLLMLEDIRNGVDDIKEFFVDIIDTQVETIIIADAVCQEDLAVISEAVKELLPRMVIAGSGGLAESLLLSLDLNNKRKILEAPSEKLLMVIGSYSPVTAKQIAWIEEKQQAVIIAVDVSKLVSKENTFEIARVVTLAKSSLSSGNHTAIVLNTLAKAESLPESLELVNKRDKNLILEALGQITNEIVDRYSVGALVLSGGDTASFICKKLGCKGIKLDDEIIPGIPIGRLIGNKCDGMVAVTKSGSLGFSDAFEKVLQYMEKTIWK
ncbi:MAG TPA: four-carbon acid sugar kinase family protein [Desulfosporosinus sp.]|nr:four-carbon acid sugar kinase family protein [Desulfosporosinus sp.]